MSQFTDKRVWADVRVKRPGVPITITVPLEDIPLIVGALWPRGIPKSVTRLPKDRSRLTPAQAARMDAWRKVEAIDREMSQPEAT